MKRSHPADQEAGRVSTAHRRARPHLEKVGAANQFIEVPDLKKTPLALSGIIVRGESLPSASQPEPTTAGEQTASNREGRVEEIDAQANPVVRRFRRSQ